MSSKLDKILNAVKITAIIAVSGLALYFAIKQGYNIIKDMKYEIDYKINSIL